MRQSQSKLLSRPASSIGLMKNQSKSTLSKSPMKRWLRLNYKNLINSPLDYSKAAPRYPDAPHSTCAEQRYQPVSHSFCHCCWLRINLHPFSCSNWLCSLTSAVDRHQCQNSCPTDPLANPLLQILKGNLFRQLRVSALLTLSSASKQKGTPKYYPLVTFGQTKSFDWLPRYLWCVYS